MAATTTQAGADIQHAARHLAEGRPADAIAMLERLVEAFPPYVTAHVLLAKAYETMGRRADALEAWHQAYFLMPASPLVVRQRARLLQGVVEPEREEGSGESQETFSDAPGTEPVDEPHAAPGDAASPPLAAEGAPKAESHEEHRQQHETAEQRDDQDAQAAESSSQETGDTGDAWAAEVMPPASVSSPGAPDPSPEYEAEGEDGWRLLNETDSPAPDEMPSSEAAVRDPAGPPAEGGETGIRPAAEPVEQETSPEDDSYDVEIGGFDLGWEGTPSAKDENADERPDEPEEADASDTEPDFMDLAADLDALIEQLERAPRIRPDTPIEEEEDDEAGAGDVVSETLARIYETQQQYAAAARAYALLAEQQPARAEEFERRAAEMRRRGEN